MPNWCEGTMKVRGTKENIFNFIKTAFEPVTLLGIGVEKQIEEGEGWITLSSKEENIYGFHVISTRRNFVEDKSITFEIWDEDKETHVLILDNYKAAWAIDVEPLVELSKEYGLDFKIHAFEKGMQFNQDIEIVNGEVIKDDEITFDDYEWECIDPSRGG